MQFVKGQHNILPSPFSTTCVCCALQILWYIQLAVGRRQARQGMPCPPSSCCSRETLCWMQKGSTHHCPLALRSEELITNTGWLCHLVVNTKPEPTARLCLSHSHTSTRRWAQCGWEAEKTLSQPCCWWEAASSPEHASVGRCRNSADIMHQKEMLFGLRCKARNKNKEFWKKSNPEMCCAIEYFTHKSSIHTSRSPRVMRACCGCQVGTGLSCSSHPSQSFLSPQARARCPFSSFFQELLALGCRHWWTTQRKTFHQRSHTLWLTHPWN